MIFRFTEKSSQDRKFALRSMRYFRKGCSPFSGTIGTGMGLKSIFIFGAQSGKMKCFCKGASPFLHRKMQPRGDSPKGGMEFPPLGQGKLRSKRYQNFNFGIPCYTKKRKAKIQCFIGSVERPLKYRIFAMRFAGIKH